MHQLHGCVLSFSICLAVFAIDAQPVRAETESRHSEIRLCSATQAVPASAPSATLPQEAAPVGDMDAPPQPVGQSDRSQTGIQTAGNEAKPQAAVAPAPVQATAPVQAAAPRPRMPAGFYPSDSVRAALNQAPGRVPIQSAPRVQTRRPGGKPFQSIESQPTVSPYLYLNAGGNHANLVTNYFGFVRPQLDQMEATRQQQKEIQQLKSQIKKISSGGALGPAAADAPVAAHYMDTAQFYHGLQR